MTAAPLAYFLSWTTKGSWVRGDERGWVRQNEFGIKSGNAALNHRDLMTLRNPEPIVLTDTQRSIVTKTVQEHCEIRGWRLFALNVRTNHIHVVVTAQYPRYSPEKVMEQFKAWSSRRLNEALVQSKQSSLRRQTIHKWWTPHGSTRWINDESSLAAAIEYVLNRQ